MLDDSACCYTCNHIFVDPAQYHRHGAFCQNSHWDHFETWHKKFKIGGLTVKDYNETRTRLKQRIHS